MKLRESKIIASFSHITSLVTRRLLSSLTRAWRSWLSFCAEKDRKSNLLRKFLKSVFVNKHLKSGMATWTAFTQEQKMLEAVFAHSDRETEMDEEAALLTTTLQRTQLKTALAVLVRILCDRTRRALMKWKHVTDQRMKALKLIRSRISSKAERDQCDAFHAWRVRATNDGVRGGLRGRAAVMLVVALIQSMKRRSSRFFHLWRFNAARKQEVETKWEADMVDVMSKLSLGCIVIRRMITRGQQASVARALRRWRAEQLKRRGDVRVLAIVVRRGEARDVVKAWWKWKNEWVEARRRLASLKGVGRRLLLRSTMASFARWRNKVDDIRRKETLVLGIWSRTARTRYMRAWMVWTRKTARSKSSNAEMGRAMVVAQVGCNMFVNVCGRMDRRDVAWSWGKWRKMVSDRRRLGVVVVRGWGKVEFGWKLWGWKLWERKYREACRRETEGCAVALGKSRAVWGFATVLGRSIKADLGWGFGTWRGEAERRMEGEERMRGCVRRKLTGVVGLAWQTWDLEVRRTREVKLKAAKMMRGLRRRWFRSAWAIWGQGCRGMVVMERSRAVWGFAAVLGRRIQGEIGWGFGAWRGEVERRKEGEVRMRGCVGRKLTGVVGLAWQTWDLEVRRTREVKLKAAKMMRGLRRRWLRSAWTGWGRECREIGRIEGSRRLLALEKYRAVYGFAAVLRKKNAGEVGWGFAVWQGEVARRKEGEERMRECVRRKLTGALGLAWEEWVGGLRRKKDATVTVGRMLGGLRKRWLRRSWARWLRGRRVGDVSMAKFMVVVGLSKMLGRGVKRMFDTWKLALREVEWGDKSVESRFRDVLRTMRLGYKRERREEGLKRMKGWWGSRRGRAVAVLFERWKGNVFRTN